jgi:ABC-type Mn2+/Zn2+ transport system permease subunit
MTGMGATFASPLMQRALLEAVMAGALAGVVGVHVVLRRLSFFTMSLTHATFPGLVLADIIGVSLFAGTAVFGLLVVLVIALLARVRTLHPSTATGVVLAGGFALGVVMISSQPSFTRDLTAFLVGSILTVQPSDLAVTAAVGVIVAVVLALLHKELVLGAFDPAGMAAMGYRVLLLDVALLVVIEMTVVAVVPAVGTILAVALIVAPAATARLWTDRIGVSMILAAALGAAGGAVGLAASSHWNIAAGPAIAVVVSVAFGASLIVSPRHGWLGRVRSRHSDRSSTSDIQPAGLRRTDSG